MALCEMRERLRTAASASSSARRWRASSIKEGNSEFFLVDSSTISSRKSCSIARSFTFPDWFAVLCLAVANLPVVVLRASGESSVSAASFSESLLTPGGNPLRVVLRSRFDSRATAFYRLAARSSSPTLVQNISYLIYFFNSHLHQEESCCALWLPLLVYESPPH